MAKKNTSVDPVADLQNLVNDMAMQFVVGGGQEPGGPPAWLHSRREMVRRSRA